MDNGQIRNLLRTPIKLLGLVKVDTSTKIENNQRTIIYIKNKLKHVLLTY